mgnify:CR=1 FL=1
MLSFAYIIFLAHSENHKLMKTQKTRIRLRKLKMIGKLSNRKSIQIDTRSMCKHNASMFVEESTSN